MVKFRETVFWAAIKKNVLEKSALTDMFKIYMQLMFFLSSLKIKQIQENCI